MAAMDYFPFPIGQLSGRLDSIVLLVDVGAAWAAGAVMSAAPVAAVAAAVSESTLRLDNSISARYVFGFTTSKRPLCMTQQQVEFFTKGSARAALFALLRDSLDRFQSLGYSCRGRFLAYLDLTFGVLSETMEKIRLCFFGENCIFGENTPFALW